MMHNQLTLALGGGGARGLAHLGVMEVLQDAGYEFERIIGASSGGLAGALVAYGEDIHDSQQRVIDFLLSPSFQRHQETLFEIIGATQAMSNGSFSWYSRFRDYLHANQMFHRLIWKQSLLPGNALKDFIEALLPDAELADAKIPLAMVAIDLRSGDRVLLERGPLRTAVEASASIPGIFPPVEYDEMLLCDAGTACSIPTIEAEDRHPQTLVVVDVGQRVAPVPGCSTALDVLVRMDQLTEAMFRRHVQRASDLVIQPAVRDVSWFDFRDPERLIQAGRDAANAALNAAHWPRRRKTIAFGPQPHSWYATWRSFWQAVPDWLRTAG